MLLIPCPHCGARDETEFAFSVESGRVRPVGDAVDDAAWADYLFFRTNARGLQAELWVHRQGCRRWLRVTRDSLTHAVVAVEAV